MISQTKTPKIKSFLPSNFAITKITTVIRLAEDETRMVCINSLNYPLVKIYSPECIILASLLLMLNYTKMCYLFSNAYTSCKNALTVH